VTPPEGDPHPKTLKHLIAARRVAAVRPEQPVRRRKPCRGASSWHLFASQPSRSGECTKLLSRLVSVVDSFVKVKGELEVDGTGDFEVGEIQNLSEVVDVEASHSSSYLDDDVAMAAMLMPEMLMELLCFRRQKFDYDDAWRRTFLPTRPLKSAFSMRAASYEPRGDDFAFT
jgi:hypothetical protein